MPRRTLWHRRSCQRGRCGQIDNEQRLGGFRNLIHDLPRAMHAILAVNSFVGMKESALRRRQVRNGACGSGMGNNLVENFAMLIADIKAGALLIGHKIFQKGRAIDFFSIAQCGKIQRSELNVRIVEKV
jgi:hypothetical protein